MLRCTDWFAFSYPTPPLHPHVKQATWKKADTLVLLLPLSLLEIIEVPIFESEYRLDIEDGHFWYELEQGMDT